MNKYDDFLLVVFERKHVMCKTFERSFSSVDEVTISHTECYGKREQMCK